MFLPDRHRLWQRRHDLLVAMPDGNILEDVIVMHDICTVRGHRHLNRVI